MTDMNILFVASVVHEKLLIEILKTQPRYYGIQGQYFMRLMLAPITLAVVESFFPPLPLIAIVALNVGAHGGILGFLYSWIGVALGGTLMFLLWRRIVKRCFWKIAGRWPKLEKAQQWVNHFDTSSLFMLMLLPFAPSSFMHLAFGISDFDEKRYLITMLLGKGVMVAMMAVFGQSLVSSMKNPLYLVLAVGLWVVNALLSSF